VSALAVMLPLLGRATFGFVGLRCVSSASLPIGFGAGATGARDENERKLGLKAERLTYSQSE